MVVTQIPSEPPDFVRLVPAEGSAGLTRFWSFAMFVGGCRKAAGMTAVDMPVGTRLGKYRITGLIGSGGMGIVYAGEDTRLRRAVAIKLLNENLAHEPDILQRFLLEARAAARLNHANVVTVHDVGQSGGAFYIVMELVSGGSVQTRLSNSGRLPWPEATRIAADVCRGLSAAHAAGIIHRDVKPANILLAHDGAAKLADFGLTMAPTLVASRLTQVGTVLGTPQYMSPEHCAAEPLDERTDVYALGVTYYALLVGHPPYDGVDPVQILYSHCSAPVPDPRAVVSSLPDACADIVRRAMAKTRTERFRSAGEMLAHLAALAAEKSATHRPVVSDQPRVAACPPTVREDAVIPQAAPAAATRAPRFSVALIAGLGVLLATVALVLAGVFGGPRSSTAPSKTAHPPTGKMILRARNAALVSHTDAVKAVSATRDRFVTAGADATARIWNMNGEVLQVMRHPVALNAVAFSPDGKFVAGGGSAKAVYLWEGETGKGVGILPNIGGNICGLAFAPSGKQLAVASENDLQLYDVVASGRFNRRATLLQNQYMVAAVAFSADGKRLAAGTHGGKVCIWELPGLKQIAAPGEFPGLMTSVALSPDGRQMVFAYHDGQLYLWEPDGASPPTLVSKNEVSIAAVVFAPAADTLVFAGAWGGPITVRDLATAKSTRIPVGLQGTVAALSFTADGRTLAAACSDGSVRLWDVSFAPAASAK